MKNIKSIQLDIGTNTPPLRLFTTQLDLDGSACQVFFDQDVFLAKNPQDNFSSVNSVSETREKEQAVSEDIKKLHFHLSWELFFVFDDPTVIVLDSGRRCFKNAIVCIPPHLNHYAICSENTKALAIELPLEKNENTGTKLSSVFSTVAYSIIDLEKDEETDQYLHLISKVFNNKTEHSKLKVSSLLTALILHVFELMNMTFSKKQNKTNSDFLWYISQIKIVIGNIFTSDVKLQDLATKLFLSEKQVSRLIKKAYNCTLSDLIINKKMEVASSLLTSTDKTISEIIKELNFKTESYFYVLFKKYYGMTPIAYRKALKIKHSDS